MHIHLFACPFVCSFIHSVTCSLHSLIDLLIHLFVCLFACSFPPSIYPCIHASFESRHVMMQRQGDQSGRSHKRAGGAVCQRPLLRCHQRPHSAAGAVSREGGVLPREGRRNVLLLALDPCNCKCLCPSCAGIVTASSMLCSMCRVFVPDGQQS